MQSCGMGLARVVNVHVGLLRGLQMDEGNAFGIGGVGVTREGRL